LQGNYTMFRMMLTALLLSCLGVEVRAGNITYDLQSYPSEQGGFSLAGTVVTDGTLGTLGNGNILSWQFKITGGGGVVQLSASSSDPNTHEVVTSLLASASKLTLSAPTAAFADNELLFYRTGQGGYSLFWQREEIGTTGLEVDVYQAIQSPTTFWNKTGGTASGAPQLPLPTSGQDWIIGVAEGPTSGAVPEPASLTLLGIATIALVGWRGRLR
jgi:hypothetical protein